MYSAKILSPFGLNSPVDPVISLLLGFHVAKKASGLAISFDSLIVSINKRRGRIRKNVISFD